MPLLLIKWVHTRRRGSGCSSNRRAALTRPYLLSLPHLSPLDRPKLPLPAPPPAAAAPSEGDQANAAADKMEHMAKTALDGNAFKESIQNMFKALKPFPEPPIDTP